MYGWVRSGDNFCFEKKKKIGKLSTDIGFFTLVRNSFEWCQSVNKFFAHFLKNCNGNFC